MLVSSRFLDCGLSSVKTIICADSVGWAACCHDCVDSVVPDEGGEDTSGLARVSARMLLSWWLSFCYHQCEFCPCAVIVARDQ